MASYYKIKIIIIKLWILTFANILWKFTTMYNFLCTQPVSTKWGILCLGSLIYMTNMSERLNIISLRDVEYLYRSNSPGWEFVAPNVTKWMAKMTSVCPKFWAKNQIEGSVGRPVQRWLFQPNQRSNQLSWFKFEPTQSSNTIFCSSQCFTKSMVVSHLRQIKVPI